MKVAVIMGSKSDYPKLEEGIKLLERFGVEVSVRALSAHRTPKQLVSFLEEIENDECKIIYIAPERLDSMDFVNIIRGKNISQVAIDEAHCVS